MTEEQIKKCDELRAAIRELGKHKTNVAAIWDSNGLYAAPDETKAALSLYRYDWMSVPLKRELLPIEKEEFYNSYLMNVDKKISDLEAELAAL